MEAAVTPPCAAVASSALQVRAEEEEVEEVELLD